MTSPFSRDVVAPRVDYNSFPLVTIGMPVYNGETTLARALESLLAQTYQNFQIIISDNASTDGTLKICEEFASRNDRVRIIRKQSNEGPVANFRTVLDAAEGEYFMWAAADDYWHPEFVSRLLPLLVHDPKVGVAMCAIERRYPDGKLLDVIRFVRSDDPNNLGYLHLFFKFFSGVKYGLFIYGLFRAELLKQAMPSFPEVLGGDRQFMSHFALAYRFAYCDEVLHIRTYQPINEERYWAEMASKRILRRQIAAFIKQIWRSPIIPKWRKLMWLAVLPKFIFFNFKQTPMGRELKNFIKKIGDTMNIKKYFYLSNRINVALAVFCGLVGLGGWVALTHALSPTDVLVMVSLFGILLVPVAGLLIRRWIIQSQKTLQLILTERCQELEKLQERLTKELRYLTDTLLHPELALVPVKDNALSAHVMQRIEKHRKVVDFVRNLEESRIREVYIEELFPGIQNTSVPIGVINELSGHANKTDMLYVSAIAKHIGARKMFEFGTYMGRTAFYLAHNNPQGQVYTLNLPPDLTPRYGPFLGVLFKGTDEEQRITQLHGDSRKFNTMPYRQQFDFVFVDGDHSYDLVKNDTGKAFELLKAGGVIIWHDYAPKSAGLVRFFREFTQDHPLFRIRSTCLLVYIDGIEVMSHGLKQLPHSLEQELREENPYLVESLYHS